MRVWLERIGNKVRWVVMECWKKTLKKRETIRAMNVGRGIGCKNVKREYQMLRDEDRNESFKRWSGVVVLFDENYKC